MLMYDDLAYCRMGRAGEDTWIMLSALRRCDLLNLHPLMLLP